MLETAGKSEHPRKRWGTWRAEESGQGVTEYSLILGLIVLAVFAAITPHRCSVGNGVVDIWSNVDTQISDTAGS